MVRATLARAGSARSVLRLQNFEVLAARSEGTRLAMEGLALTGAWVDRQQGLISTSCWRWRLVGSLRNAQAGRAGGLWADGTPTEIPSDETVVLAGGGLGNAVRSRLGRRCGQQAAACSISPHTST